MYALRRCGYDDISITDIMKQAGLTHDGSLQALLRM
jgi:hypothetical protein